MGECLRNAVHLVGIESSDLGDETPNNTLIGQSTGSNTVSFTCPASGNVQCKFESGSFGSQFVIGGKSIIFYCEFSTES